MLSDSDSEGTSTSNNTLLRGLNKEVASRVRGRKRKASTGRAGSAASSTIDKWYQRQAAVVPTSKAWVPTSTSALELICPECKNHIPVGDMEQHWSIKHPGAYATKILEHPCALCVQAGEGNRLVHLRGLHRHFKTFHKPKEINEVRTEMIRTQEKVQAAQYGCSIWVNMAAQAKNKKKTGALRPQLPKKQKYIEIVKECVEDKVSLVDLVDKWKVNWKLIIDSVQNAGLVVPPECKVWTFLSHGVHVRCKECASKIRTKNLMKHFAKCHKEANINDGSCAVCKENVRLDALQFHHYCAQNPHLSASGPLRPLRPLRPPQNPHSLSPSPSPPQKRQRHQPPEEPVCPSSRPATPNECTENTRNVVVINLSDNGRNTLSC